MPQWDRMKACPEAGAVIQSSQRMTDALRMLESLRDMGATDVVLHPDGSIARVTFGHDASAQDEHQNEAPTPKRMSATGGLVPRASHD
jgi:hypothetical protein